MLEVRRDLTIILSRGDVLDLTFTIQGFNIDSNSEVFLSIKHRVDDEEYTMLKQCNRVDIKNNKVRIVIESKEMAKIPVGRYYYDLLYKLGENTITLNYPSRLVIREVVHDV